MDSIRIPSSRPVVVDSATILVSILKHPMNLEIDAVVSFKGQLISELIFGAFKSPKKPTKLLTYFCPRREEICLKFG